MTPFEIFRSSITVFRNVNGFFVDGRWQEGSQATLSIDLVIGNTIAITLNGIVLTPIVYTTSHAITMALIAEAIEMQPNVKRANLSGTNNRTITVIADIGTNDFFDSFVITGGVSQPVVMIETSPEIIPTTASIQPVQGEDMQEMPEGRQILGGYKLYTSFHIRTVTNVNPDQVEIFGKRYEVVQVFPWQNNTNFAMVNHYKYLTLELEALGAI